MRVNPLREDELNEILIPITNIYSNKQFVFVNIINFSSSDFDFFNTCTRDIEIKTNIITRLRPGS